MTPKGINNDPNTKIKTHKNMSAPRESLPNIKCGACNKYLSHFPIYIAQDKVPICGRCSEILAGDSTYIRDTPYESLAQHLKFPCIYDVEGCVEYLHPEDVPGHEKVCPFRVIPCNLDCMWQGTVNDLLQHFEELHPEAILRSGEFEMDFSESYEIYSLLVHEDELFCFKRKFDYDTVTLECSLACYKVIDSITKYNYEVAVENGSNRSLGVTYEPKSAENFQKENVTKIGAEEVKNKLNDPSIIIGTVRIFAEDKKPEEKPKKPFNEINVEMLRELECPVCMDYIIPPIYQCVTGHSICGDCKEKVTECPTCKQEIKGTQNFTLEKMAFYLTYPCKFTDYGCDFASKPGIIKQHQKYCLHGPQFCPLKEYKSCLWKSSAKDIFSHVFNAHHDNTLEIDSISIYINENYFEVNDCDCYILKFSDLLFKLHYNYKANTRKFMWSMQLIGPPEESKKYKFEIDIVDNNNNGRRMFLRSFCSGCNDKEHTFEDVANYVYLKRDQIRSFITDVLTYRIRVIV